MKPLPKNDPAFSPAVQSAGGSDVVLQRLLRLHPKVIDLSLERIERLLAALGHPERALAPVVHVAGTNGKGSTIAFLRAILEAAGKRVQVYSSPHLVRFHERVRLAGGPIAEPALQALLEEAEAANAAQPITFFEITTAAAFLAFSREPADVLLLETGLGGRLDATNVIDRPLACAITPISLDHTQYLGPDIAAIAAEKAGIVKPGVPLFSGPQTQAAAAVLREVAQQRGAALAIAGQDWAVKTSDSAGLLLRIDNETFSLPRPALLGAHQYENAGLAVALARRVFPGLGREAMARGLREAEWPGRLQRLRRGPLVEALPQDWELWLDGGHNPSAGEALGRQLDAWQAEEAGRATDIVFGMLNTKAARDFVAPLATRARRLQAIAIAGEAASLSAEEAAAAARAAGAGNVEAAEGSAQALARLVAQDQAAGTDRKPARILVCGSLYLAGQILRDNG